MSEETIKENITIHTNTVTGSTFSQAAGVTVSEGYVTLDFVFVDPRTKVGTVVSRVTLPKESAVELSKTIAETIKDHDKRTSVDTK